jgi:uncharacterized protein (AIM24 family)
MTSFRKLEESAEADGVKIDKYRFVEKRLITRGIPTTEGGFHYVAEATDIFQLCITLTGGSILLEPGALQYMHGNIETTVQKHEDKGFFGRALASAGTGESAFATKFTGHGTIWTEPGRRNFILANMERQNDALLLDDRAFYACSGGISLTTHRHQSVVGVLSGNGLMQPKLSGKGVFAVEAPVPVEEIDHIDLDGTKELVVDGDFMLMYSATLTVSIGPLVKGLRNAFRSGEGFVYKLAGKGEVYVMPTAKVS